MKRIIDSSDAKRENGLRGGCYGPENHTIDIPTWFHLMFGFAQNEWNNLIVP